MSEEIGELRELLAEAYKEISGKTHHSSDCGTSNSPAETPTRCDCDVQGDKLLDEWFDAPYRELDLGEKILVSDVFIYNGVVHTAKDIGNGIYTVDHLPHYRANKDIPGFEGTLESLRKL